MKQAVLFLIGLTCLAVLIAILGLLSSIMQKWICNEGAGAPDDEVDPNHQDDAEHLEEDGVVLRPLIGRLNAIVYAIHNHSQQRKPHERTQIQLEKVTIIVLRVTAFLAFVAAVAAGVSALIFNAQLEESRDEQRPWITVTPELDGPITYDSEGVHFKDSLYVQKYWLPAIEIHMHTARDLMKFKEKYETLSVLQKLCETKENQIQPFWLFPNDSFPYWETFDLSPIEIAVGQSQDGILVPGILPVINTCVNYSAAYGKTTNGVTAVSYQIVFLHGRGFSYVPVGRTVQQNEILIMPNISEGSFLK